MVTIDSLKLRFNVVDVEIVNKELEKLWGECTVSDDGEIEVSPDEFKKKAFDVRRDGITTRYHLVKRRVNQFETRESLVIMASAKTLEKDYFKGIWIDTIEQFYHAIMSQGIVRIPFEKFVEADVTDCDIKADFPVKDLDAQRKIVEVYRDLSKPTKKKDKGYFSHNTEKNVGIEWSSRAHATPSCPYVKIYAKDVELKYKSMLFAFNFLGKETSGSRSEHFQELSLDYHLAIPPTMRMEATIKNRAHFRLLFGLGEMDQFRLCDIVGKPQPTMERVINDMLLHHISLDASIEVEIRKGMTLSEVLAVTLLSHVKSLELAKLQAEKFATNKSQAYLVREKLTYCWNAFIPESMKVDLEGLDDMLSFTINAREKEQRYNQIQEAL